MALIAENKYCARIGGLIYKDVTFPIMHNEKPILEFFRDEDSKNLSVTFDVYDADMNILFKIVNNNVEIVTEAQTEIIYGKDRLSVIDPSNYRSWCDIKYEIKDKLYEIDISFITYIEKGLALLVHPDRTKFFDGNNHKSPNISRISFRHEVETNTTSAIVLNGIDSYYFMKLRIENFHKGLLIKY